MEVGGIEPPSPNSQTPTNKDFTDDQIAAISEYISFLSLSTPDLAVVLSAWSHLPEHVRQTITTLVEAATQVDSAKE